MNLLAATGVDKSVDRTREVVLGDGTTADRVNGILVLNKPGGMTSRAVVDQVGRLVRKVRVGHAGTLDPLATGVLVVCLGTATRLVEVIQRQPKTYVTSVRLGARSDTLDADGAIEVEADPRVPTTAEIAAALRDFVGQIEQTPPRFSAVKLGGKRAYELARAGKAVTIQPRTVRIDAIRLRAYTWPSLTLEVNCGGGTYIRSLASDIAAAVGTWGFVATLERTRIGDFTLEQAADPRTLVRGDLEQLLLEPAAAVSMLPRVVLDAAMLADILQGRSVSAPAAVPASSHEPGFFALLDPSGSLAALAELDPVRKVLQPRKVLLESDPQNRLKREG